MGWEVMSEEEYARYQARWQNAQQERIADAQARTSTAAKKNRELRQEVKAQARLIDVLCKAIRQRDGMLLRNEQ